MIIQIFGTKKCAATRKAERFFKDRGVAFQFRDVGEKPPSRGELEAFARALGAGALIDVESRKYKDEGWSHRDFEPLEALTEHPGLLLLPLVRGDAGFAAGDDQAAWKRIASAT